MSDSDVSLLFTHPPNKHPLPTPSHQPPLSPARISRPRHKAVGVAVARLLRGMVKGDRKFKEGEGLWDTKAKVAAWLDLGKWGGGACERWITCAVWLIWELRQNDWVEGVVLVRVGNGA